MSASGLVLATLVVILIQNPLFGIVLVPLALIYYFVQVGLSVTHSFSVYLSVVLILSFSVCV